MLLWKKEKTETKGVIYTDAKFIADQINDKSQRSNKAHLQILWEKINEQWKQNDNLNSMGTISLRNRR